MNQTWWSIGQVSKSTGLTVRTLHFYEALGLVVPSGRGTRRCRVYCPQDVQRLHEVILLKHLGIPLKRIAGLISKRTWSYEIILKMCLEYLETQQKQLTAMENSLKDLVLSNKTESKQYGEAILDSIHFSQNTAKGSMAASFSDLDGNDAISKIALLSLPIRKTA